MSKILTGLKTSEMIRYFEEGKAESCKPERGDAVRKEFNFQGLGHWYCMSADVSNTWSVKLKERKIELTEEQLAKAWDDFFGYINSLNSKNSSTFKSFKKKLGFE